MEKITAAVRERKADSFFVTWWTLTCCTATGKMSKVRQITEEFDHLLAMFLPLLTLSDLLMITADQAVIPIRAGRLRTIRGSTCRFWRIHREAARE